MKLWNLFKKPDLNQDIKIYYANPQAVLIDVRSSREYSQGHLPNSKNVPLQHLDEISHVVADKSIPVFTYCYSGVCAKEAAKSLRRMGYSNVRHLGGIKAYRGRMVKEMQVV